MGTQLTISELVADIRRGQLILPEFQRGYVWTDKQVREYLGSLYRGYPTGSFLIWKTPNPGLARGGASQSDGRDFQLILDGQQRLTSAYTLIEGVAPPFYEGDSLYFNVHFNVCTEEFSYYKPTIMKGALEWVPVTRFLQHGLGGYLKKGGPISLEEREYLYDFFDRLQQLDSVKEYSYYLDVLGERNMDQVVHIFNLVNSKGTRLWKSDLALSHICALWPEARQTLRAAQKEFSDAGFGFDLSFYVRLTASVGTGSGFYEPLYNLSAEQIQASWKRTKSTLEYLLNVLKFDAFIDSAGNLASETVLVPMVVYLANGNGVFRDDCEKRQFLHWMYGSLMWARYSGAAETALNQDLEAIRSNDPIGKLRDNLIAANGRIQVDARDLALKGTRNPLFNMSYIVARSEGAVDWFNGLPLYSKLVGKSRGLETHHVFPQSRLYKEGGFDSKSNTDRQKVNEIANLAFLTKQANLKFLDNLPANYLPDVPELARTRQSIPNISVLWDLDRYEDFLAERRSLLAASINKFMERLLEGNVAKVFTIDDYIDAGESESLEFKSSLRWDYRELRVNKSLEKVVAKTIAAFMNSSGGTLIIGLADDGKVLGLDADLKTFNQRQDLDVWEQSFRNVLNSALSKEIAALVKLTFSESQGCVVAVVHAGPARRPVYLLDGTASEFYIRSGNTTQQLNVKEALEYSRHRFPETS